MKWMTIDYIKKHSRICDSAEDSLLELYAKSAEDVVLSILNRTYENLVEEFGTDEEPVPAAVIHATLLIVDQSYEYRSPGSKDNLSRIDWNIDSMLAPYMKLTYK